MKNNIKWYHWIPLAGIYIYSIDKFNGRSYQLNHLFFLYQLVCSCLLVLRQLKII